MRRNPNYYNSRRVAVVSICRDKREESGPRSSVKANDAMGFTINKGAKPDLLEE